MGARFLLSAGAWFLLSFGLHSFAQTPLENRFDEETFQKNLGIDTSRPLFASPGEASERFSAGGKWSFKLSDSIAYDSNAFRQPNALDDLRWDYGFNLAYEWWTSERIGIVITPSASVGGQRYDCFHQLNGDMLGTGATVTLKKIQFSPEFSYAGGWGFESGFGDQNYTEHVLSLAIADKIPLQKKAGRPDDKGIVLSWKLLGGYQFTDPSVLDRSFVSGSLGLNLPLTKALSFSLNTALAYRSYTHFQPEKRETLLASVSAAVAWQITDSLALNGKTTYARAEDRISTKDYDQVLASIALSWSPNITGFLGLPLKPGYLNKPGVANYGK